MKNNTVAWATGRAKSLVTQAKTLAQAGKSVYSTNRELVMDLAAEITGLRSSLHGDNFRTPFAEQPISYAKAFALLATARKVQSGWAFFSSVRRTGIKAALSSVNPLKAKPQKGPARRSFCRPTRPASACRPPSGTSRAHCSHGVWRAPATQISRFDLTRR